MIKTRRNIRKKSFKSKKRLNQRLKKTSKKRLKRTSKRGGCHRDYTDADRKKELQDRANELNEVYPNKTIEDLPENIRELSDFNFNTHLSSLNKEKKQMIYFVKNYPDKTYEDFYTIITYDNMLLDNSKTLILDVYKNPIINERLLLKESPGFKLWNFLHKEAPSLKIASIVNTEEAKIKIESKKNTLLKTPTFNNELEKEIKDYIKNNQTSTYEDWIEQHPIFKKYIKKDEPKRIFAIMYIVQHPALKYWNENSSNKVSHEVSYKVNDEINKEINNLYPAFNEDPVIKEKLESVPIENALSREHIKSGWETDNAVKEQVIHFVKNYPDKTITEYGVFSQDYDNLYRKPDQVLESKKILILDENGHPIMNSYRELQNLGHVILWNILHKNDELKTTSIIKFEEPESSHPEQYEKKKKKN